MISFSYLSPRTLVQLAWLCWPFWVVCRGCPQQLWQTTSPGTGHGGGGDRQLPALQLWCWGSNLGFCSHCCHLGQLRCSCSPSRAVMGTVTSLDCHRQGCVTKVNEALDTGSLCLLSFHPVDSRQRCFPVHYYFLLQGKGLQERCDS